MFESLTRLSAFVELEQKMTVVIYHYVMQNFNKGKKSYATDYSNEQYLMIIDRYL